MRALAFLPFGPNIDKGEEYIAGQPAIQPLPKLILGYIALLHPDTLVKSGVCNFLYHIPIV